MKYASATMIALLLAGCGGGERLDPLFAQQADASCRSQGFAPDTAGYDACYDPAYAKARDVR